MKNVILLVLILFTAGCQTVPPYTGPTLPSSEKIVSGIQHKVQAGQTLWKISQIYNIDIDDILRLNHISEDAAIEIGQTLLIPKQMALLNVQTSASSSDDFIWPLKGRIIAGFGANYHNLINKGINIQAQAGADILAIRGGRVVFYAANFGNFGKISWNLKKE